MERGGNVTLPKLSEVLGHDIGDLAGLGHRGSVLKKPVTTLTTMMNDRSGAKVYDGVRSIFVLSKTFLAHSASEHGPTVMSCSKVRQD